MEDKIGDAFFAAICFWFFIAYVVAQSKKKIKDSFLLVAAWVLIGIVLIYGYTQGLAVPALVGGITHESRED